MKTKKFLSVFALLVILTACAPVSNSPDITAQAIESEVVSIQAEIRDIKATQTQIAATQTAVAQTIFPLQTEISNIETEIGDIESQISSTLTAMPIPTITNTPRPAKEFTVDGDWDQVEQGENVECPPPWYGPYPNIKITYSNVVVAIDSVYITINGSHLVGLHRVATYNGAFNLLVTNSGDNNFRVCSDGIYYR